MRPKQVIYWPNLMARRRRILHSKELLQLWNCIWCQRIFYGESCYSQAGVSSICCLFKIYSSSYLGLCPVNVLFSLWFYANCIRE